MNPLHILLLLLLIQNGSRHSGYNAPLRIPEATYMLSNLRQTLDTIERMSQMTNMIQQIPTSLPSPENHNDTPDLSQLMQNIGPMLQMLNNSNK